MSATNDSAHEAADTAAPPTEDAEQAIARGRSPATPFLLLGSVAVTVWTVAALVTLVTLAIVWLT